MHLEEEQTRIPPAPKVNFRRASRKDISENESEHRKNGPVDEKASGQHVFMGWREREFV